MHILRAPLGGAFRHVYDLATIQSAQGLKVVVVCDNKALDHNAERRLKELDSTCKYGVKRISIPRSLGIGDIHAIRFLRKVATKNREGFNVIHGHGAKGSAYARLIAPKVNAVSICTPHGGALHYSRSTLSGMIYLSLERLLVSKTQGMIFESRYAYNTYAQKVGKILFLNKIIHNGLYPHEFKTVEINNAKYDFLFVGEFRKLKGIYILIDAIRILKKHMPVTLIMVGSGPEKNELKRLIKKYKLEDCVSISEPIHPVHEAFKLASNLVIPSTNESFPYLVLEALAARIPLITTLVGGISEIYGPYSDQLVPPSDPEVLAERMSATIKDPQQALHQAQILHSHLSTRFQVTKMANEIEEFYQECLCLDCV